jgi:hypothetical protein
MLISAPGAFRLHVNCCAVLRTFSEAVAEPRCSCTHACDIDCSILAGVVLLQAFSKTAQLVLICSMLQSWMHNNLWTEPKLCLNAVLACSPFFLSQRGSNMPSNRASPFDEDPLTPSTIPEIKCVATTCLDNLRGRISSWSLVAD